MNRGLPHKKRGSVCPHLGFAIAVIGGWVAPLNPRCAGSHCFKASQVNGLLRLGTRPWPMPSATLMVRMSCVAEPFVTATEQEPLTRKGGIMPNTESKQFQFTLSGRKDSDTGNLEITWSGPATSYDPDGNNPPWRAQRDTIFVYSGNFFPDDPHSHRATSRWANEPPNPWDTGIRFAPPHYVAWIAQAPDESYKYVLQLILTVTDFGGNDSVVT